MNNADQYNFKNYFSKLMVVICIGFLGCTMLISPLLIIANDVAQNIKIIVLPILCLLFMISNILAFWWLKKTSHRYYYYYPVFAIIIIIYTISGLLIEPSKTTGMIFLGLFCLIFAFYFAPIWIHFRKFKLIKESK